MHYLTGVQQPITSAHHTQAHRPAERQTRAAKTLSLKFWMRMQYTGCTS